MASPSSLGPIEAHLTELGKEVAPLGFALDQTQAELHRVKLERNRLREKFKLIEITTRAMLVEPPSDSLTLAHLTLRSYAGVIRGYVRRP